MADLKGRPVAVKIVNTSLAKAVRVPEMAISKIRHRNVLDIMAVKHNVDQQRISGREGSGLSLCWDSFSSGSFSELAKGIPSKNGGTYYPTQETWILMEYCDLGSLFEAIREKRFHRDGVMETPAMEMILCVAAQVADAMACLHRSGIVHGDLKTQNIFLKTAKDTPLGFVAKVGDFGTSRMLKKNDMMHTNLWGTVDHMAPEVLKDGEVRTAMDVFSFGMILLEFLTAQRPFAGKNSASILMSIVEGMRPEIPSYIPRPYAELIQDCWNQDWKKRPSFRQLHRRILSLMQQMRQWDRQSRDKRKSVTHAPHSRLDCSLGFAKRSDFIKQSMKNPYQPINANVTILYLYDGVGKVDLCIFQ